MKNFLATLLLLTAGIAHAEFILVQSTTSTQNSGLYDYLLPKFSEETGIEVRVVAVGTGQAIRNAANGDADVLLVHAKASEEKFVAEGNGVERFDLMYNDFVIIGPAADPAGVKSASSIDQALAAISSSGEKFVSRGDDSGTHKKELALWGDNKPSGANYIETGSGMGATIRVAIEMQGYTMSDRATWLAYEGKQDAQIVFSGDDRLFNQYGIIMVNPDKHSHVKVAEAQQFIDWMRSDKGQSTINSYQVGGEQLFFANAQ